MRRRNLPLLRLIYQSAATGPLDQGVIEAIARRAEFHNRRLGITGFLLHQAPGFHAVLEGPARHVLARMEIIITDPRHTGVHVVREEAVVAPRFGNWQLLQLPAVSGGGLHPTAAAGFVAEFARRLGSRVVENC